MERWCRFALRAQRDFRTNIRRRVRCIVSNALDLRGDYTMRLTSLAAGVFSLALTGYVATTTVPLAKGTATPASDKQPTPSLVLTFQSAQQSTPQQPTQGP